MIKSLNIICLSFLLLNRRPLFRQSGVVSHVPSRGSGKQVRGQRSSEKKDFHGVGNSCDIFIEPLAWMADMILTIEGKVSNRGREVLTL